MKIVVNLTATEKLLSFYQTNRFQQFDTRQTTSSEGQHELGTAF